MIIAVLDSIILFGRVSGDPKVVDLVQLKYENDNPVLI